MRGTHHKGAFVHSFRRRRLARMLWVATLVAALFAPLVGTAQADPPEVTFGPANEFATGLVPRSVAIGDLNADTLPDVVTANSGSDSVSVLLGDGAGSFGATTDFGTADQPASVVILDLLMVVSLGFFEACRPDHRCCSARGCGKQLN